jgi:tetratricopeptide (TPR) repeat protein
VNRFDKLIQTCQELIRNGDQSQAARLLNAVNTARVPRPYRLPLTSLCLGLDLLGQGFRIMSPIISPKARGRSEPATPQEQATYASLLEVSGNIKEALKRLTTIDAKSVPQTLLYQAYCHMACWRSEQAVECLRNYLKLDLPPSERRAAQLNLASALTGVLEYNQALNSLNELAAEYHQEKNVRMFNAAVRLRAHIKCYQGDVKGARADATLVTGQGAVGADYFHNFELISFLEARETGKIESIIKFRVEAERAGFWFGVRNADLNRQRVHYEKGPFKHLYFGTPYESFRRRIRREIGREASEPFYVLGPKLAPRFNLMTAELDGVEVLNPGKKVHQLLEILLRDFYVPLRMGGLFAELFPDEYFDIFSSPERVHQVIWRARDWVKEQELPIEIHEHNGFYSIRLTGQFSFLIPLEHHGVDSHSINCSKLDKAFGTEQTFAAREGRALLDLSPAGFKKFVSQAVARGELARMGHNKTTVYRVQASPKNKKAG